MSYQPHEIHMHQEGCKCIDCRKKRRSHAAKQAHMTQRKKMREATPLNRARMKLRAADNKADTYRKAVERAVKNMATWHREVFRLRRLVERLESEQSQTQMRAARLVRNIKLTDGGGN